MNLKSVFTSFLILAASMFSQYFCLRPSQPPQVPVAYSSRSVRTRLPLRAQSNDGPTSKVNEWKHRLQTCIQNPQTKVSLSFLKNERTCYLSQKQEANIDLYMHFINLKRQEVFDESVTLEKHHILPRFAGGGDQPENLISLTPEDHRLAHLFRYLEYGNEKDASVVLFRSGYNEEARQVVHQAALKQMKEEQKGRWDPKLQSELGKKRWFSRRSCQHTNPVRVSSTCRENAWATNRIGKSE